MRDRHNFIDLCALIKSIPVMLLGTGIACNVLPAEAQLRISTLTVTDVPTIREGDSGTKTLRFTVLSDDTRTLIQPITGTYSVVSSGRATGGPVCSPGVDFVSGVFPYTFPAGSNPPFGVDVTICGDTVQDEFEGFIVCLHANRPAFVYPEGSCQHGVIQDDDAPPPPSAFVPQSSAPLKPIIQPVPTMAPPQSSCRKLPSGLIDCSFKPPGFQ